MQKYTKVNAIAYPERTVVQMDSQYGSWLVGVKGRLYDVLVVS